ncbi:MAG: TonB-dependent receptor [Bacteroidetes bacterium]|nr:TonB-dependent receptor [Bacteroidota bacterium]
MKKNLILAMALLICHAAMAQMRVTGTVTASDDGTPVSYATIAVKGSSNLVTTTDLDGKFVFANIPGNAVLVISYIGYVTQEIPVNNRSAVNIALSPDALALEELMVVAYGTAKKSTYTGSAAMVTADKIKDVPIASFEEALNGKVAGMQVTGNTGKAGSATNIRIRGTGSMNAGSEPLYVIDGVPVVSGERSQMGGYLMTTNVLSTLNPNDIEQITVLKDAAASALYGSRAANGVIVVTTKKGKMGKTTVNFKSSVSISPTFATDNWELAKPEEMLEMLYELFWNGEKERGSSDADCNEYAIRQLNNRIGSNAKNGTGLVFSASDNTAKTLKATPKTDGLGNSRADANGNPIYFDWEKALFRTGVYQTYDLSVSGGTENTTVYSSIGYTKDKGRTFDNEFSRISGRVNVTQKVGKFMELTTIAGVSSSNQVGFNDTRNQTWNYFYMTRNLLWPYYYPTDYKTGEPIMVTYGSGVRNPVYYHNEWDNSTKTQKLSASEALTINFLPELTLRSIVSYDNTNIKDHVYYSALHFNATGSNGSISEVRTDIQKLVSSTTLNYNKSFADRHNVSILAGFETDKETSEYVYGNGTQLPTSTLHTLSTAGSTTSAGYEWGSAMVSLFSRAEYNYNLKYFVSGSFRRDGSSRFSPENRWGNFWSVSGAWSINKEKFMESFADVVNNLRLRVAYGVNGTTPSSNYAWRSLTSYTAKYNEKPGGGLANIGNDLLTWESNYTTNVGLDFGLFDNRLRGAIEYFNRDSKNLLQDVQISRVTGFSSTLQNVGEMNNKGWEVEIGGDIIRNKNWHWDASLSASFIKSKIVKLYGGQDIRWESMDNYTGYTYIYKEGYSNLELYAREWAGVDQTNGKNVWYTNNEYNDPNIKGFKKNVSYDFEDADEVTLGDMNPKVYGGFNTNLSWKNLSLGLNFIYKIGGYTYDKVGRDVNDDGYFWERVMSADTYKNRWTYEKRHGKYPLRIDEDLEDALIVSSRHRNPGDFLRLKNISLSYSLPKGIVNTVGISGARIYFTGSNLLTFAAYKVYDPEVNYRAYRNSELPISKTYTFGLEINF